MTGAIQVASIVIVAVLVGLFKERKGFLAKIGELKQKVFHLQMQAGELSDGLRLQKASATDAERELASREIQITEMLDAIRTAVKERDKARQECRHLANELDHLSDK